MIDDSLLLLLSLRPTEAKIRKAVGTRNKRKKNVGCLKNKFVKAALTIKIKLKDATHKKKK